VVWCYYSQFLPTVRKFQESPLQTRLNDEIKISRWDELNVYTAMEHSERVHRKLTKIIREYEADVLYYPVTAVLQREIMSSMISEHGELKQQLWRSLQVNGCIDTQTSHPSATRAENPFPRLMHASSSLPCPINSMA
jgi:midasin (ATPase involved in ribosome maturation)